MLSKEQGAIESQEQSFHARFDGNENLLGEESFVVQMLLPGELHPHNDLLFLRQLLNILLHPPQQDGFQVSLQNVNSICCLSKS